eukprot:scaffold4300_cov36-Tisochrysis_lutea.AAC.3
MPCRSPASRAGVRADLRALFWVGRFGDNAQRCIHGLIACTGGHDGAESEGVGARSMPLSF